MNNSIVIGEIALSFHAASAAVFHLVLHHMGYKTESIIATHEKMFDLQKSGSIDLLISSWLPGSHGKYLAPYEKEVIKFKEIYSPYCIWGVPDYVQESLVSNISDLAEPHIADMFDKDINGIGPGAGISRFSLDIIEQYGLLQRGYYFISNSKIEDFFTITESKINNKNWFIIPLWQPQYLHKMFSIRSLKDPRGLLRSTDAATPIMLKSSAQKIKQEHLDIISQISLGNKVITDLDYTINKRGKSPIMAAQEMIDSLGGIEYFIKSVSE